jgi:hypothetical protein
VVQRKRVAFSLDPIPEGLGGDTCRLSVGSAHLVVLQMSNQSTSHSHSVCFKVTVFAPWTDVQSCWDLFTAATMAALCTQFNSGRTFGISDPGSRPSSSAL